MSDEPETAARFRDRVADYERYRPTYPVEAIDAVLDGLGEPESLTAADVGAGTGISARLLAERGVRVFAIEPGAAMRAAGEAHRAPGVTWIDASAESTTLADGSVDLVLCAQSYHWFDPRAACREFARILRAGGRLALVWNDADEETPLAKGYYDLLRSVSTDQTLSHKTAASGPTMAAPFEDVRALRFRHAQRMDFDGLIGRAMSASYVPREGEGRERVMRGLRSLHGAHADAEGVVALEYNVVIYVSEAPR